MNYINQNAVKDAVKSVLIKSVLLMNLSILTACSVVDSRPPNTVYIPAIPEIERPKVATTTPKRVNVPKTVISSRVKTQRAINTVNTVVPVQRNVSQADIALANRQRVEARLKAQQQLKANATRNIDPFAAVPESSSNVITKPLAVATNATSSSAVNSLMVSARADIAIGRGRSAVSKLERGLRIQPGNAELWHMLARAHYTNSAYLNSINVAKKSNGLTTNDDLKRANWNVIKQAGERSGNTIAVKEALDYIKVNP